MCEHIHTQLFIFRSVFVYFLMFGVSISPFFDMSAAPRHIKEDKRMKYLLGMLFNTLNLCFS